MSTTVAAVIMIVVVVVVGGLGYVGLNATAGSGNGTPTCSPSTSPLCGGSGTNDVALFVAYQPGFGQSTVSVAQGASVPAT
ncbi:MAG: hypothetical protein ACREEC_10640, partial [Thermoplasmata archaeon]